MNIISGLIKYFGESKKDFSSNKFEVILRDWRNQLSDPRLTAADRATLINNIAKYENLGKGEQKRLSLIVLAMNVGLFAVGLILGPVAAGITKVALSRPERSVLAQKRIRIVPARIIGGRRRKGKKSKGKPFSNIPDVKSVSDGVFTSTTGAVSGVVTSHTWIYLGEILRFLKFW